jgi:hypothetical protein
MIKLFHTHLKKIVMFLILCVSTPKIVFSQNDTNNTKVYFGGSLGVSKYALAQNEVPVNPYFNSTLDIGASVLFEFTNSFFMKTGVSYTYYRSPFINNVSVYDEFLQIPVLLPCLRMKDFNEKGNLILTMGTQISILSRQGQANTNDVNYQILPSTFGGFYKFGVVSEIAIYNRKDKVIHSYGLKFSMDLPSLYIKSNNNLILHNNYVTGSIFYNFNATKSR